MLKNYSSKEQHDLNSSNFLLTADFREKKKQFRKHSRWLYRVIWRKCNNRRKKRGIFLGRNIPAWLFHPESDEKLARGRKYRDKLRRSRSSYRVDEDTLQSSNLFGRGRIRCACSIKTPGIPSWTSFPQGRKAKALSLSLPFARGLE